MKKTRLSVAVLTAVAAVCSSIGSAAALTPDERLTRYEYHVNTIQLQECAKVRKSNDHYFKQSVIKTTGDFLLASNISIDHSEKHPSLVTWEDGTGLGSFNAAQLKKFFELNRKDRDESMKRLVQCGLLTEGPVTAPQRDMQPSNPVAPSMPSTPSTPNTSSNQGAPSAPKTSGNSGQQNTPLNVVGSSFGSS